MGRPPKPTALKVLEGNRGKRPLPQDEPKPEPGIPPCPEWLGPAARAEWRRLTSELAKVGLVTHLDRALLVAYCQAWADFRAWVLGPKADEKLPAMKMSRAVEVLLQVAPHFGLSPSTRTRLHVPPKPETDELGDFLSRGPKKA